MGAELKLVIGEIWRQDEDALAEEGPMRDFLKEYGQSIREVARVDLSGVSEAIWSLVHKAQGEAAERYVKAGVKYMLYTDTVVVNDDGTVSEKHLFSDKYGNPIGAIKLTDLLPVLKEEFEKSRADYSTGDGYRRYELAIAIIDVMLARFAIEEKHRLVALTWGH